MKLTSPSTYAEAITGQQLTPAAKLAFDVGVFGLAGGAKSLLTRGLNKTKLIIDNIINNRGFAFKNPFRDNILWIGRGLGSHIEISPTTDGWLGVDFIRSTDKFQMMLEYLKLLRIQYLLESLCNLQMIT